MQGQLNFRTKEDPAQRRAILGHQLDQQLTKLSAFRSRPSHLVERLERIQIIKCMGRINLNLLEKKRSETQLRKIKDFLLQHQDFKEVKKFIDQLYIVEYSIFFQNSCQIAYPHEMFRTPESSSFFQKSPQIQINTIQELEQLPPLQVSEEKPNSKQWPVHRFWRPFEDEYQGQQGPENKMMDPNQRQVNPELDQISENQHEKSQEEQEVQANPPEMWQGYSTLMQRFYPSEVGQQQQSSKIQQQQPEGQEQEQEQGQEQEQESEQIDEEQEDDEEDEQSQNSQENGSYFDYGKLDWS